MRVVLTQALIPSEPVEVFYWPLGLGYLAAYARRRLEKADFVYAEGRDRILSAGPDVVGISTITENFRWAAQLCRELRKDFRGPIVLGGAHISALPSCLPAEADAGVLGEGEETFVRLLELIERRGGRWKEGLKSLRGVCRHGPGGVTVEAPRAPIADLDAIPFPDRAMLGADWSHAVENPTAHSLLSSRGCPHACKFCFSTRFWRRIRRHGAAYVVAEALQVRRDLGATNLNYLDDLFTSDKGRLSDIASRLRASGLADEASFLCTVRSDQVDEGLCKSLVRMNAGIVSMGVESGSDDVLRLMNKRTTVKDNARALARLARHGIKVVASVLLGFPGETVRDMDRTAEFIARHLGSDIEEFELYPAMPYPGTWLWRHALKKGILPGEGVDGRGFGVAEATFDPVHYPYLNASAPKETFLRYFYQLKCLSYRGQSARRLRLIDDLRRRLSTPAPTPIPHGAPASKKKQILPALNRTALMTEVG
ncbi:MAG: radical SAM protein, partial [Elusimicrobia bacterium]|nr:radical SAM protein [Elusimicrobiota bacterium]